MTRAMELRPVSRRAPLLVLLVVGLGCQVGCASLRALGILPDHDPAPEATRLAEIAIGLLHQGKSHEAIPIAERSLAIREKALGPNHIHVAYSLDILAAAYEHEDADRKAEELLQRAREIRESSLGKDHPEVGKSLDRLSTFYMKRGNYAEAYPLSIQALDIFSKHKGQCGDPCLDYAMILNHAGTAVLLESGQSQSNQDVYYAYNAAELVFTTAAEIYQKLPRATHPDLADSLEGLALVHEARGEHAKAGPFFARALAIREATLGPMHPRVASSLGNLAAHYQAYGAYASATSLLVRALQIQERALGPTHPDVAVGLNRLARQYQLMGSHAAAEPLLVRATEIQEDQLRLRLPRLSEQRKLALMKSLQDETDGVITLSVDLPSSPRALGLALTTVLRRKGRVLDVLADNHRGLRERLPPTLRGKLQSLASDNDFLKSMGDPKGSTGSELIDAVIRDVRWKAEQVEAELNAASTAARPAEPVTIEKIQAALPPGTMLVEIVRYRHITPSAHQRGSQLTRYVAYLLPSRGASKLVEIGEAGPIDAAIDAVLGAMRKDTRPEDARAALQHLDALLMGPLRAQLSGVSHVILSPDGKLNLVPFEALVDGQGHYELEGRLISYVISGRDLQPSLERHAPRSPVTIVAAPEYGNPRLAKRDGRPPFYPLPGTFEETTTLTAHFAETRVLVGRDATKTALAALTGPGVLHIATHAFYERERAAPAAPSGPRAGSALASYELAASFKPEDSRGIGLEAAPLALSAASLGDPLSALDRAGLALEGANVPPIGHHRFGIATAREIAGYDWWGTKLVVLSACETGVGAVPSGEGVFGLRRALVLAGTESQVVSLWSVSDTATGELMRVFYGELARGTGRAESLRRAKLALMQQPQFDHPYYWAAFIAIGDWTPLDPSLFQRKVPDP